MAKLFTALEENNIPNDAPEMTPSEVEVLSDQVLDSFSEFNQDSEIILEEFKNAFDYCDHLITVAKRIEENKAVSAEDLNSIRVSAENLAIRYDLSLESIYPSISLEHNYEVALENIKEKVEDIISKATEIFKDTVEKILDNFAYSFNVLSYNNEKQRKLSLALSNLEKSVKTDITYSHASKNFRYDEDLKLVKDFSEYYKEYNRLSDVMIKFNELTSKFVKEDFLSGSRLFFDMITFKGNKRMEELYDKIDNFYNELSKIDKFYETKGLLNIDSKKRKVYTNKPMLGGKRIVIAKAENKDNSLLTNISVYVSLANANDKLNFSKKDEVTFSDISSKDILNLIKLSDAMTDSVYLHKNIQGILSQLGSIDSIITKIKTLPETYFFLTFSRAYRAHINTSITILNSAASAVAYTIKQQKQVNALAEQYLKSVQS